MLICDATSKNPTWRSSYQDVSGENDTFTQSRPPSAGRRATTAIPNRSIAISYITSDHDILLVFSGYILACELSSSYLFI